MDPSVTVDDVLQLAGGMSMATGSAQRADVLVALVANGLLLS